MDTSNLQTVLSLFRNYYQTASLEILSPEKREFGVGVNKKIDARHLSFGSLDGYRKFLMQNTPLYTSHSIAYYGFPGATPMEKKQWEGADLVFDLDLHAEGKYGVYELLSKVKEDCIFLMEEFLLRDFGLEKKDLLVVFSGNRGYHIHVRHKDYLPLGSDERRELVDYVKAVGLDYRNFFVSDELRRGIVKVRGPKPDDAGYRGRLARSIISTLTTKPSIISRKYNDEKERDLFISGIKEGNYSKTSLKDIITRLEPVAKSLSLSSVDTDAGVTQDTSKLIRVPNSIHGETGFIAKVVPDISTFDPLQGALLSLKGIVKIKFLEDVPVVPFPIPLGPFKKDEEKELDAAHALFFVCKGSAVYLST